MPLHRREVVRILLESDSKLLFCASEVPIRVKPCVGEGSMRLGRSRSQFNCFERRGFGFWIGFRRSKSRIERQQHISIGKTAIGQSVIWLHFNRAVEMLESRL